PSTVASFNYAPVAVAYWGPHFPPKGASSDWDGHFPEGITPYVIAGSGPAGSSTFALVLDEELIVRWSYRTAVFKAHHGEEKRSQLDQVARTSYSGTALLLADGTRANRARLAR